MSRMAMRNDEHPSIRRSRELIDDINQEPQYVPPDEDTLEAWRRNMPDKSLSDAEVEAIMARRAGSVVAKEMPMQHNEAYNELVKAHNDLFDDHNHLANDYDDLVTKLS